MATKPKESDPPVPDVPTTTGKFENLAKQLGGVTPPFLMAISPNGATRLSRRCGEVGITVQPVFPGQDHGHSRPSGVTAFEPLSQGVPGVRIFTSDSALFPGFLQPSALDVLQGEAAPYVLEVPVNISGAEATTYAMMKVSPVPTSSVEYGGGLRYRIALDPNYLDVILPDFGLAGFWKCAAATHKMKLASATLFQQLAQGIGAEASELLSLLADAGSGLAALPEVVTNALKPRGAELAKHFAALCPPSLAAVLPHWAKGQWGLSFHGQTQVVDGDLTLSCNPMYFQAGPIPSADDTEAARVARYDFRVTQSYSTIFGTEAVGISMKLPLSGSDFAVSLSAAAFGFQMQERLRTTQASLRAFSMNKDKLIRSTVTDADFASGAFCFNIEYLQIKDEGKDVYKSLAGRLELSILECHYQHGNWSLNWALASSAASFSVAGFELTLDLVLTPNSKLSDVVPPFAFNFMDEEDLKAANAQLAAVKSMIGSTLKDIGELAVAWARKGTGFSKLSIGDVDRISISIAEERLLARVGMLDPAELPMKMLDHGVLGVVDTEAEFVSPNASVFVETQQGSESEKWTWLFHARQLAAITLPLRHIANGVGLRTYQRLSGFRCEVSLTYAGPITFGPMFGKPPTLPAASASVNLSKLSKVQFRIGNQTAPSIEVGVVRPAASASDAHIQLRFWPGLKGDQPPIVKSGIVLGELVPKKLAGLLPTDMAANLVANEAAFQVLLPPGSDSISYGALSIGGRNIVRLNGELDWNVLFGHGGLMTLRIDSAAAVLVGKVPVVFEATDVSDAMESWMKVLEGSSFDFGLEGAGKSSFELLFWTMPVQLGLADVSANLKLAGSVGDYLEWMEVLRNSPFPIEKYGDPVLIWNGGTSKPVLGG